MSGFNASVQDFLAAASGKPELSALHDSVAALARVEGAEERLMADVAAKPALVRFVEQLGGVSARLATQNSRWAVGNWSVAWLSRAEEDRGDVFELTMAARSLVAVLDQSLPVVLEAPPFTTPTAAPTAAAASGAEHAALHCQIAAGTAAAVDAAVAAGKAATHTGKALRETMHSCAETLMVEGHKAAAADAAAHEKTHGAVADARDAVLAELERMRAAIAEAADGGGAALGETLDRFTQLAQDLELRARRVDASVEQLADGQRQLKALLAQLLEHKAALSISVADAPIVDVNGVEKRISTNNADIFKFMPMFHEGTTARFDTQFAPLRLTLPRSKANEEKGSGKTENYDNIGDALAAVAKAGTTPTTHRFHALLEAPAGAGKSTLVKWLALHADSVRASLDVDVVIVVELLRLEQRLLKKKGDDADVATAADLLAAIPKPNGTPLFAPGTEAVGAEAALEANKHRVLWVLDGYDEVQNTTCQPLRALLADVHHAATTPGALPFAPKLLVTSRPERDKTFKADPTVSPLFSFERFAKLRVLPWTQAVCDTYIDKFPDLNEAQKVQVRELLESDGFDAFERLPFAVHLVCCAVLMHDGRGGAASALVAPSDVFAVVVVNTVLKRMPDEAVAQAVITDLEALAFGAVVTGAATVELRPPAMRGIGNAARVERVRQLAACGLLTKVGDHAYKFLHKTLLEFLAARHLLTDPFAVDAPPAESGELPRARIDAVPLDNGVVLHLLGDMLRCRGTSEPSAVMLLERAMQYVAGVFTCKESLEPAQVESMLRFFLAVAIRPPVDQRDADDSDGTKAAMEVLFSELTGQFEELLSPSAALGALYAVQRIVRDVELDDHQLMRAAVAALGSRRGGAVVKWLKEEKGVSPTLLEAVEAQNEGAVMVLLPAPGVDPLTVATPDEWREMCNAATSSFCILQLLAEHAAPFLSLRFLLDNGVASVFLCSAAHAASQNYTLPLAVANGDCAAVTAALAACCEDMSELGALAQYSATQHPAVCRLLVEHASRFDDEQLAAAGAARLAYGACVVHATDIVGTFAERFAANKELRESGRENSQDMLNAENAEVQNEAAASMLLLIDNTVVEVSECQRFNDEIMSLIAQRAGNTLCELSCDDCRDITDVAPLAACTHLKELNLGWTDVDEESLVLALRDLTTLEVLNVSFCDNVGNKTIVAIGAAPCAKTLTELDCNGCDAITDVAPLAVCKKLTKLNLGGTEVTDASLARALAGVVSLEVLGISGCETVSDLTLQTIAAAPCAKTLCELDCSDCEEITDVAALYACKKLTKLNISGTEVKKRQRTALKRALPELCVVFE